MSEYEPVKSALDAALSQTRAAMKAVSENAPAAVLTANGLIASMRAAVQAADDPRNRLLTTLINAV